MDNIDKLFIKSLVSTLRNHEFFKQPLSEETLNTWVDEQIAEHQKRRPKRQPDVTEEELREARKEVFALFQEEKVNPTYSHRTSACIDRLRTKLYRNTRSKLLTKQQLRKAGILFTQFEWLARHGRFTALARALNIHE